jgi:hypothetical protein
MIRIRGRWMFLVIPSIIAFFFLVSNQAEANVDLLYFRAESGTDSITLQWETASELDNLGFNILRSDTGDFASAVILNPSLIPSLVGGQPIGAYYEWMDETVEASITYSYWLQDIDFNGGAEEHGPVEAAVTAGNTIPTIPPINTIQPTETSTETPEPSPSATRISPTQETPTSTSTPRTAQIPSQTSTPVPVTSTEIPFQPTLTESPNLPPTSVAQSASPVIPSREPTTSPQVLLNMETRSPEIPLQQAAEVVAESIAEQETGDSLQDRSPSIVGEQPVNELSAQSIGSDEIESIETDDSAIENDGVGTSSATLALIILVAALLIAVAGGVTVWLMLRTQAADQENE